MVSTVLACPSGPYLTAVVRTGKPAWSSPDRFSGLTQWDRFGMEPAALAGPCLTTVVRAGSLAGYGTELGGGGTPKLSNRGLGEVQPYISYSYHSNYKILSFKKIVHTIKALPGQLFYGSLEG